MIDKKILILDLVKNGAGEGIRTLDFNLGNVVREVSDVFFSLVLSHNFHIVGIKQRV